MEIVTSWEEKGQAEGVVKGQRQLVERLLLRKLGAVPQALLAQVASLSSSQLTALGEALLDCTTVGDLEGWLAAPPAQDEDTTTR